MPDLTIEQATELFWTLAPDHHDMTDAALAKRALKCREFVATKRGFGLVRVALARQIGAHALELLRPRQAVAVPA